MRILQLTAENVKRLKVVDITPNTHLQQVTGKNGSGKSSTLDSIFYALAGKDVIPGKPIRTGEQTATVRLDLGEIIVKRTFTRDGDDFKTTLLVLNPVGAAPGTPDKKLPKWDSPQKLLDAILGELTFDPLKFANAKPREQSEELRKISKISIDIDAINAANAVDYAARTDINRDAKGKRAQAEAIAIPEDTSAEYISESEFLDQIEGAGKVNADIERRRGNRDKARRDVTELHQQAAIWREQADSVKRQAEARIEELKRQIAATEKQRDTDVEAFTKNSTTKDLEAIDLEAKLNSAGPLPDLVSITELRASLDAAKAANALVEKRKVKARTEGEAEALEAQSRTLTQRIADREQQVSEAIKAADMPVEGLGFGADFVTYNKLPFDQASDAERLRVSTAIAMAANPKLRIIRIKDGSLLDDDGIRMVAEMAQDKDFQVFLEKVDGSGMVGVYMEDGEVAAVNP